MGRRGECGEGELISSLPSHLVVYPGLILDRSPPFLVLYIYPSPFLEKPELGGRRSPSVEEAGVEVRWSEAPPGGRRLRPRPLT